MEDNTPMAQLELLAKTARIYNWDRIHEATLHCLNGDAKLHFIRHGHTLYNDLNRMSGTHNTRLSATGRLQAIALASRLTMPISLALSSDLHRAFETASIYCKEVGIRRPIVQDRRLREVNLGVMAGRKRTFVEAFAVGDIDYAPDRGESYRQASRRIASWLTDVANVLQNDCADLHVAVFTHNGAMRIIHSFFNPVANSVSVFKREFGNSDILSVGLKEFRVPTLWTSSQHGGQARWLDTSPATP